MVRNSPPDAKPVSDSGIYSIPFPDAWRSVATVFTLRLWQNGFHQFRNQPETGIKTRYSKIDNGGLILWGLQGLPANFE
jgi:hypothetical protein